jgi:hypothetical protein
MGTDQLQFEQPAAQLISCRQCRICVLGVQVSNSLMFAYIQHNRTHTLTFCSNPEVLLCEYEERWFYVCMHLHIKALSLFSVHKALKARW